MGVNLPVNGYFNSGITNSLAKNAQDDMLAFIRQSLLGGAEQDKELAEITGGSLPTVNAVQVVDTEAQASNDVLDRVDLTNLIPGQFLALRIADNGRVVTITHGAGGIGQILLHKNVDFVLNSTKKWLVLRVEGQDLVECWRSFGDDSAAYRTFLDLGNVSTLAVGDGLTDDGAGNLDVQLEPNSGLSIAPTGLALNIPGLVPVVNPAVGDLSAINNGGGNDQSITLANLLKVVNGLPEDVNPDTGADFSLTYDASDNSAKKVKLDNLGGGSKNFIQNQDHTNQPSIEVNVSGYDEVTVWLQNLSAAAAPDAILVMEAEAGGAWLSGSEYEVLSSAAGPVNNGVGDLSASEFDMTGNSVVDRTGLGWRGTVTITGLNVNNPSVQIGGTFRQGSTGSNYLQFQGNGVINAASAVTKIRFRVKDGTANISGQIALAVGRKFS